MTPTLLEWQKLITHAVFVEGEVQMGTLCEWLARMWEDAYEEGASGAASGPNAQFWREERRRIAEEQRQTRLEETEHD